MVEVRVEDALGMVLCHDMTLIIPGEYKGIGFKKGHVITEEDIPKLLDMGKKNIYAWSIEDGYLHENDAVIRMVKAAIGEGIVYDEPKEGKITLRSTTSGVLKINIELLYLLNEQEDICFSTIHGDKEVVTGKLLAGARVIPLIVKEDTVTNFETLCNIHGPLIRVIPFVDKKIGLVITGSEIKEGRIEDRFTDVLISKAEALKARVIGRVLAGDDVNDIREAILQFIEMGCDLVEISGGMSVDPDDRTPGAIKSCGGEVITYGTPVLPGAMFMLSYVNDIPVVGLPGCVMYAKRTVYDLIVPRILVGDRITRRDFIMLAHGGQCQNCNICTYPDCGFGR